MLYGSRLSSYTTYAQGLWSGPNEWIIQQMAHKKKSANPLTNSEQLISFSYHYLPITDAYNAGTSWLWSKILTLVTCHDSSRTAMPQGCQSESRDGIHSNI
jgi:hypothetical protein